MSSFVVSVPGSYTASGGKGKGKKQTFSEVNVLGESSSSAVAGQKRGSEMMDNIKNEDENSGLVRDYSKLTVPNLKDIIDERGVSRRGVTLKAALIALLVADDEDPSARNVGVGEDGDKGKAVAKGKAAAKPGAAAKPKAASSSSKSKSKAASSSGEPAAKKPKKAPKAKPPPYVRPRPEDVDHIDHRSVATGEKRLRPYQPFPDEDMHKKIHRVRTERLFMLDRSKGLDRDGTPQETFQISGSTGNVYEVVFGKKMQCNCANAMIGSQQNRQKCKHILYVKMVILKVDSSNLVHQIAYLSSEVQEIFANAPVTQLPILSNDQIRDESIYNGKRKPVEGDCSICMMEFEDDDSLVFCKSTCGQNFHEGCINIWKGHSHGNPKCPYCRAPWQEDPPSSSNANFLESLAKEGFFRNIGHLPMYQDQGAAQDD